MTRQISAFGILPLLVAAGVTAQSTMDEDGASMGSWHLKRPTWTARASCS